MDKFRFRRLERYQKGRSASGDMELGIPLPKSASGMVYRFCPSTDCTPRHFLLGDSPEGHQIPDSMLTRVRRTPGQPGTTCPYCGGDAEDNEYTHSLDEQYAMDRVKREVKADIADWWDSLIRSTNRGMRRGGSLINARTTARPRNRPKPFVWREDLLRSLTCDTCQSQYGVYAIALFCPGCGKSNLRVHFRRELELIQQQVEVANHIETDGQNELAFRLLGNAHEDVVTALETYLKTVYRFVIQRRGPEDSEKLLASVGNAFQNIERARTRFVPLDMDPYASLDDQALQNLRTNIEKRHVVGHNLSMADDKYAKAVRAEDTGKTVQIVAEDVLEFSQLVGSVVDHVEAVCPELQVTAS